MNIKTLMTNYSKSAIIATITISLSLFFSSIAAPIFYNPIVYGQSSIEKNLSISFDIEQNPISLGSEQKISVVVTDKDTNEKISGAAVGGKVTYAGEKTKTTGIQGYCLAKSWAEICFGGYTDQSGQLSYSWRIDENSKPGLFTVELNAGKEGYTTIFETSSFEVVPTN